MKKFLLAVGCGLGVIVGSLLLWYIVFPLIGAIFQGAWGFVTGLF